MAEIKHQQRLLLEWLIMAGNIAVSDVDNGSLLYKTQVECEKVGWIKLTQFGSGFFMAAITDSGQDIVRNRRQGDRSRRTINRPNAKSSDRRRTVST